MEGSSTEARDTDHYRTGALGLERQIWLMIPDRISFFFGATRMPASNQEQQQPLT